MIKQVRIKNFQSHKDTIIDFDKGLNIIRGTTDSGKSSIIRAISWVLFNRPTGDAFKFWGMKRGEAVSVKILFTDGNEIERVKSSGVNEYNVNGKILKALRTDVPIEVKEASNMTDVNLQPQYMSYFLFGKSPGEISKSFNEVADLSKMSQALTEINSDVREINDSIARANTGIEQADKAIEELNYVDDMDFAVKVIEELDGKIAEVSVKLSETSEIIEHVSAAESELADTISDEALDTWMFLHPHGKALADAGKIHDELFNVYSAANVANDELDSIVDVDASLIATMEVSAGAVKTAVEHAHNVNTAITIAEEAFEAIEELETLDDEGEEVLDKILEAYKNLQIQKKTIINFREVITLMQAEGSVLACAKEEFKQHALALDAYENSLDVCPLCGGELA